MVPSQSAQHTAGSLQGARGRPGILRDALLFAVLLLVVWLDQGSKLLVRGLMEPGSSVPAQGFLRITYTTNTGSIFGLFPEQTAVLTAASIVAVGALVYFYHAHPGPGRLARLSLGLLLGGAVGNLADRLRLGYVVDFMDVGPWPVFNLADSSIVVGIALLVALVLLEGRARAHRPLALPPPSDRAEGAPEGLAGQVVVAEGEASLEGEA